jgi:hypothetical protein
MGSCDGDAIKYGCPHMGSHMGSSYGLAPHMGSSYGLASYGLIWAPHMGAHMGVIWASYGPVIWAGHMGRIWANHMGYCAYFVFNQSIADWAGFRSALRASGPVGGLFTDFRDGVPRPPLQRR